ncbi:hypothetical protein L210DRAFT_3507092 [Boletus edulis BED1]|uniref:Uncharacterized protein n=1 Tax=Boletus edulis BED1 TaxID=1328754 RepID=A0AAD4BLD6_BOLED|nr:hypothetical protein L210DRAFT_3507092 [Boletus edulis BED1]
MYYSIKHDQVAMLTTTSSELTIMKRDLINLWVHFPPQENIWCINRSSILQWLSAGTVLEMERLTDLLHMQWSYSSLRPRESIMMKQEGILICATAGNKQTLQDVPSGTLVETLAMTAEHPTLPSPTEVRIISVQTINSYLVTYVPCHCNLGTYQLDPSTPQTPMVNMLEGGRRGL